MGLWLEMGSLQRWLRFKEVTRVGLDPAILLRRGHGANIHTGSQGREDTRRGDLSRKISSTQA